MASHDDPTPGHASRVGAYVLVTIVATPSNLGVLALLLAATAFNPTLCTVLAATIVSLPSFVACRRWVWSATERRRGQLLAFWGTSMVNVAASSSAVWCLERAGCSRSTLAVVPTVVYALLWVVRYVVLDRLVFARSRGCGSVAPIR